MHRPDYLTSPWRPNRFLSGLLVVLFAATCISVARADPPPAPRVALVIGNSAYGTAPSRTSVNDAALVAESLALVGFDVTALANADAATTAKAVENLTAVAKDAGPKTMIVVYLAGYGLQRDGQSFFAPADAIIDRDADVPAAAIALSTIVRTIEAIPAAAHLFFFDLARDNPFVKEDDMPLAPGLALATAAKGSLYGYNTAPGAVAAQDDGPYGAYARALSEMLLTPNLSFDVFLSRVRLRVGELTDGADVPWGDDAIDGMAPFLGAAPATFSAQPGIGASSAAEGYSRAVAIDTFAGYLDVLRYFPNDALAQRVRAMVAVRRDALFWAAAQHDDSARAYWTYMRRYPRGPHFFDARRRLAALKAPLEPPPRFDIVLFPDLPPPSADELPVFDRPMRSFDDDDWPPIPAPPPALLPTMPTPLAEGLPPPPLFPDTILPIAVPILPVPGVRFTPGIVTLPNAPRGPFEARTTLGPAAGDMSVTVTRGGTLVSRAAFGNEGTKRRSITQTGPDGAILSKTVILNAQQGVTIVQTGPSGGVVRKSVTWREPDGGHETVVRDGGNQVIQDIKRNAQGIVVSSTGTPEPRVERKPPALPPRPPIVAPPLASRETPAPNGLPPPPPKVSVAPVVSVAPAVSDSRSPTTGTPIASQLSKDQVLPVPLPRPRPSGLKNRAWDGPP